MYLLESPRRGDSDKYQKTYFLKKNMGLLMKKNTRTTDLSADRIDVLTNFSVITNEVIKRVHCTPGTDLIPYFRYKKKSGYQKCIKKLFLPLSSYLLLLCAQHEFVI